MDRETGAAVSRSPRIRLSVLVLAAAGCATLGPDEGIDWITTAGPGFTLATAEQDRALIPELLAWGSSGRADVEAFFGRSFRSHFVVRVFPDRASLVAYWVGVWHAPSLDDGCGAVAAARGREITYLSPAAWPTDACGLDAGSNQGAVILTHELVHVLHEHWNPRLGEVAHAIPWFVEGLAVYASGQLRRDYAGRVKAAVVTGQAPTSLEDFWMDSLRYGLAGSMVAYLDIRLGRRGLDRLLTALTLTDILTAVGGSKADLLVGWRTYVATGSSG